MQFNRELAYYARRVLDDVYHRRSSAGDALIELRNERDRLKAQSERITLQSIGVVGGTGQFIAGAGICYGSLGLLCATLGAPMIAHGGSNIYENARGLYEGRDDIEGPVKKGYREVSKGLGYTEREGTLAYLAADATLSVGALLRPVLKADAWRLYKYYSVDKEVAVKQMGRSAVFMEGLTNGATAYQFSEELKK